ncbi:MAG: NAD(P)H-hydrate dehydratase [Prevotella sp.]
MKIFTSHQIKELDNYTITHEPIESINLMERAAKAIVRAITVRWHASTLVMVFAGPGNNGGDALAVARLLAELGYRVQVFLFNISDKLSADCAINRQRIGECKKVEAFTEVTQEFDPPQLQRDMLVIDGLFGSGLSKPLAGGFASLVKYINASPAQVVSIDVPSGLMTEDNTYNVRANIIRADYTFTLQQPKLSFFFPENQVFIGQLETLDIKLSAEGTEQMEADFSTIGKTEIQQMMLPRSPFAHKGTMGHALLVAGSYGMGGAAILAAKACLRSGVGKLTVHCPKRNNMILQMAVPEAVIQLDQEETIFTEPVETEDFNAMGIGPGLGTNEQTSIALIAQLRRTQCPIVADADALNILANHRAWIQQLPKDIIMTPHVKEFDRLAGQSSDSYERLTKAINMAKKMHGYIILKGHHTAICMPDGKVRFNTTGNAGMATAGSGDVLTGILTALLARGYKHGNACMVAVYLHGLAGDLAAEELGMESVTASDIIHCLPAAFKILYKKE